MARSGRTPVYLRVVSRVYLAGGELVSLSRSGSQGIQGKGGFIPPAVSMVDSNGNLKSGYTNLQQVAAEGV